MAYSSILGADVAPAQPSGRDSGSLGPSDNSDSGSDAMGTSEVHGDSDSAGTGERGSVDPREGREGGDILPDHIVKAEGEGATEDELDDQEFTDLDASEPTAGETDEDREAR